MKTSKIPAVWGALAKVVLPDEDGEMLGGRGSMQRPLQIYNLDI